MTLKRIVRLANILVILLLVAAAGVVYWFAYRPLPETSGTIRAPISARGTIDRDDRGFPRVNAASVDDALFLQGYATAQDRMWQMDGLRRAAAGRLSEVFGPAMLELDRNARRLRMEHIAEEHAASMPAADRAVLAAYARGVNYYIETHRGRLSLEFSLLGYDPRPWRIVDSVLIGLIMYRDLTTTWKDDLEKAVMLASGDRQKVAMLLPTALGGGVLPGSNAWAISGRLTATGKPILANDPHLEYSIPGIWHVAQLRAPGLNVAGAALPGVPGIVIGHNGRIAWGATNLGYDVQDLYIEKLDPATGRYVFRGQMEQARLERDVISVKGAPPVEYAQWITRHGPVALERGTYMALRWAAAEPGSFQFPFIDLNRARNWQEFTAALARYPGPGQNFVYADVDGNIGYQATGRLPVRRTYDGDVPVDGSSGDNEWDGFIPFDQLPAVYNPPSGIIATANQNPFPADFPYRVGGNFASPYRVRQIRDMLSAHPGWRASDMVTIQKDVYSDFLVRLARAVVRAWDQRRSDAQGVPDAVEVLRKWNGQVEKGTAAPLIAALTYQHLRSLIGERAARGGAVYGAGPVPNHSAQAAPFLIDRFLASRPKDWFADWDHVLVRSLSDAVEEGQRIQGRKIDRWDWGAYNRLLLAHPVGSHLPLVGGYFNIGPVAQSGWNVTVKQTTRRLGPSLRLAADTADWDASQLTLVTGVSGHVLSSHYKDNWDAYYAGRGLPFKFRNPEIKGTLVFEPRR